MVGSARPPGGAELNRFDTVVIGSGFGGAVVAARLAEAGRSVCVLERGRRFEPHQFPRTFGISAGEAVWDEQRSYGLLEYRVFRRIDVINGVGVGGGSLHYFNVSLRAPDAIFQRPEWPAGIDGGSMGAYYDRVEDMITPSPLVPPAGFVMPRRTEAFMAAARAAGYDPELVPLAIHTGPTRAHPHTGVVQQPCTMTSDCLLGCRPRSKNSLDVTYLPAGERHGLEIRPLHVVEAIERSGQAWSVKARVLDPEHPGTTLERVALTAERVVVAAGSVGSTELLLRCRDTAGTLPRLPSPLGQRFSANGDMLFAGTKDCAQVIDPTTGPSITAGAFVHREGSPHLVQIQDLSYPPALTGLFDGALPIRSRLAAIGATASGYVRAAVRGQPFAAGSVFAGSPVPHFLPYLGMGTDAADGRYRIDPGGRLRLDWDPAASAGMYEEMEQALGRLSSALGGSYVPSLPWRRPFRRLLTAHPLGGCVMGDSPLTSVVDHRGEVWDHPGLFVCDGAMVPGPLAVNPSLTIAALAERCAQWMLHGHDA